MPRAAPAAPCDAVTLRGRAESLPGISRGSPAGATMLIFKETENRKPLAERATGTFRGRFPLGRRGADARLQLAFAPHRPRLPCDPVSGHARYGFRCTESPCPGAAGGREPLRGRSPGSEARRSEVAPARSRAPVTPARRPAHTASPRRARALGRPRGPRVSRAR